VAEKKKRKDVNIYDVFLLTIPMVGGRKWDYDMGPT